MEASRFHEQRESVELPKVLCRNTQNISCEHKSTEYIHAGPRRRVSIVSRYKSAARVEEGALCDSRTRALYETVTRNQCLRQ